MLAGADMKVAVATLAAAAVVGSPAAVTSVAAEAGAVDGGKPTSNDVLNAHPLRGGHFAFEEVLALRTFPCRCKTTRVASPFK